MFKLFALVFVAILAVATAGYVAPGYTGYASPYAYSAGYTAGYVAPYTAGYASPYAYSAYNGHYGYAGPYSYHY